jgi:hypothetical protein
MINKDNLPPEIPPGYPRGRELVFMHLTDAELETLKARGYVPICLYWLARNTPAEELEYLRRFMQGVAEGTVQTTKAQLEGLWFEMKSRGLLEKYGALTQSQSVALSVGDLRAVLSWKDTPHRTGATTMVAPEKVAAFLEQAAAARISDRLPAELHGKTLDGKTPGKKRRKRG